MRTFKIVGVTRINYKDKQTGDPRTLTQLHMVYEDEAENNLIGCGVLTETCNDRVFRDSGYEPTIGDDVHLFYLPDYKGQARLALIQPVE